MKIDKVVTLATAFIQNSEGKVLLLQRGTKSSFSEYWQFVEGKIEANEYPDEALKREIQEEISISPRMISFKSVSHTIFESAELGVTFFVLRVVFSVILAEKEIRLSQEHIDYRWCSIDEIRTMNLVPGVKEVIELMAAR